MDLWLVALQNNGIIVFWGVGLGQGPGRAKKADAYCSKHMLASLSGLLLDSHLLVFCHKSNTLSKKWDNEVTSSSWWIVHLICFCSPLPHVIADHCRNYICSCGSSRFWYMGMDQYLLIPFLVGWTSIYQLFWCSPGVQGFDTLLYYYILYLNVKTPAMPQPLLAALQQSLARTCTGQCTVGLLGVWHAGF